MSLHQANGLLFIALKPSRCLAAWIIFSHSLAALGLTISPWLWWLDLTLLIMMAGSCLWLLKFHVWRTAAKSVVQIQQTPSGWLLLLRDGTLLEAALHFDTLVMAKLVVLNFNVSGKARPLPVVIMADAINQEQLRTLRVVLRWSSSEEKASTFP